MKFDLNFAYKDLLDTLAKVAPFEPDIAIILGSGLGKFAESLDIINSVNTVDLKSFPESTVNGHEGKIHFAKYANKNILLFQGRIHFYEGYTLSQCILPVHIAAELSSKKMLLTNAAGGVNTHFIPGTLMLVSSFVSTNLKKEITELLGLFSIEMRNRFIDFPSSSFNSIIKKAALLEKILLNEGVYWYSKGPAYETPAEIKMISRFGADAVGMSTVHEAIYACYRNMETSTISCITNYAAGISDTKLSHIEVTETANRVRLKFEGLLKKIISMI